MIGEDKTSWKHVLKVQKSIYHGPNLSCLGLFFLTPSSVYMV
jgi:hypothetical protein